MSALQGLSHSVNEFSRIIANLPDADLERPWAWGDYEEGVRFIYFRIYETLRGLAADLAAQRAARPLIKSQALLKGYLQSYNRLQVVLLGIDDVLAEKPPAENEWPLRSVIAHLLEVQLAFWKINAEALLAVRAGNPSPPPVPEPVWVQYEQDEPAYKHLERGPLSVLLQDFDRLHRRTLQTFATVGDSELETPVWFWESKPMPLLFRLARFDSHLAQHTIQAEKTLAALHVPLTESRRLLFRIYEALADCEGAALGSDLADAPAVSQAADAIGDYVRQTAQAL